MKKISVFIIILCYVIFHSCRQNDNPGIICTADYRMLTITIKDTTSNPVKLSNYFVKKTSTGEIINFTQEGLYFESIMRQQGQYLLITDREMGMTSMTGTAFEFHGRIDSTEVLNEKYLIGNDRCHVTLLSGNTKIVLLLR